MWFFGRKRNKTAPYLIAGGTVMLGYLAYRQLARSFEVPNPDLALRHGANLTRRNYRVMAVTAHQDDLEYLAGGTLRLLALAGSRISAVVLSAGNRQQHLQSGSADIRNQEQFDAGTLLGYDEVRYLGFDDLSLAHNPELEPSLASAWNELNPELVLAMDPAYPISFIVHPDHLTVGRVVLNLFRKRAGEQPQVLFYGSRQPNVLVDVSKVIEDKIQGVLSHKSQLKTWPWVYGALIRSHGRLVRQKASIPYGESFRSLTLPPLEEEAYQESWDGASIQPDLHPTRSQ